MFLLYFANNVNSCHNMFYYLKTNNDHSLLKVYIQHIINKFSIKLFWNFIFILNIIVYNYFVNWSQRGFLYEKKYKKNGHTFPVCADDHDCNFPFFLSKRRWQRKIKRKSQQNNFQNHLFQFWYNDRGKTEFYCQRA